jgi:hypothetical protein
MSQKKIIQWTASELRFINWARIYLFDEIYPHTHMNTDRIASELLKKFNEDELVLSAEGRINLQSIVKKVHPSSTWHQ